MANYAIALDGTQHFTTPTHSNAAGSIFEIKFKLSPIAKNIGLVASSPTATNAYVRINSAGELRARGAQTGSNTAPPGGVDVFDGEWHVLRVHYNATSHQFELDGFFSAVNNQNVAYTSWGALCSFFTNAKLDGQVEYMKWVNNGANSTNWSPDDSNRNNLGFQPVLTDTLNGINAQGVGFPETDLDYWVSLGAPDVTAVGTITLPPLQISGSATDGSPDVTAVGTITLPPLQISGSATDGSPGVTAVGTITLPPLQISGSATDGSPDVTAVGTITLPPLQISGSATDGSPDVTAVGTITLPPLQISGSATDGSPDVTAVGTITLPPLQISGSATDGSPGVTAVGTITLPPLQISGTDKTVKTDYTVVIDSSVKTIQTTSNTFTIRL